MATTIHYPSEASTIDVLWNILNQQSDSVKKALLIRLNQSLSNKETNGYKSINEALAFVDTLSVKSGKIVPAHENGIEALINEKYLKE